MQLSIFAVQHVEKRCKGSQAQETNECLPDVTVMHLSCGCRTMDNATAKDNATANDESAESLSQHQTEKPRVEP